MHIATKANETNTKNKSFKKAICLYNGKIVIIIYPFPSVSYFAIDI